MKALIIIALLVGSLASPAVADTGVRLQPVLPPALTMILCGTVATAAVAAATAPYAGVGGIVLVMICADASDGKLDFDWGSRLPDGGSR